ncbi:MAG TPA: bifunctional NUDIX hydrolase/histidine phosphatase family protein [Mycobacteriales bacterium]|nr:bifunctional NUDIX hydrolase/histidine phosphatase family protein [Mycobacteriales bacterium]
MSGERILAAGGVLWRPVATGREICLVHRPRYDDWSLPKGKLDAGEHPLAAAVREVREETGVRPVVGQRLATQEYTLGPDRKLVDYWSMTPADGTFVANDEVDSLRWVSPAEAAATLTYERDREFVASVVAAPVPDATVLLVRHAKAGSRSSWKGEDALRPLDATGQRQAEGLRRSLRWFGPAAIRAAEPLRCVQTVAPLAADLGLSVGSEPALSEEVYEKDPAAGLDRVLAAAATGGVTVLVSQGGVIPDLLGTLAALHGVRPGRRAGHKIPARKSGVWALSFLDTRLLAADYYPDLATAA